MLEWLRSVWNTYRPRKSESAGAYDGPLSIYREYHALTVGLAAGLLAGTTGTWEFALLAAGVALGVRAAPSGPLEQLTREPWYALGGIVLGFLVGTVV